MQSHTTQYITKQYNKTHTITIQHTIKHTTSQYNSIHRNTITVQYNTIVTIQYNTDSRTRKAKPVFESENE